MRKRPAAVALDASHMGQSEHYPEWLQIEFTHYEGSGQLPPPLFWTIHVVSVNQAPISETLYSSLPPKQYFSKRVEAVSAARSLRQSLLHSPTLNIEHVLLRVNTVTCPKIHPGLTDAECQEYFGISVYQETVPTNLYPLTYHPYFTLVRTAYEAARIRDIEQRWCNLTLAMLNVRQR